MNKQRKFMLIAAAIGAIAMFLPWISFMGIFTVNGMHGVGILVFLCFIACIALSLMGDQAQALDKTMWMIALIASGLAALIMLYYVISSMEVMSNFSIGFYLALLASLALLYVVYAFRNSGYNIKDGFESLKGSIGDKNKPGAPPAPPPMD